MQGQRHIALTLTTLTLLGGLFLTADVAASDVIPLSATGESCERCYPVPAPAAPPGVGPHVTLQLLVPAKSAPGKHIEYRIVVENRSQAAAHKVTVHNAVPGNAKFVKSDPAPSTTEGELQWRLGTLEGGAKREILLTLQPKDDSDITNCVRVSLEHGLCVVTRIAGKPAAASLSISKRGPALAQVGETLSYQLTIANGGAPVRNVTVKDTLPDGLEHASKKQTLAWELGGLAAGESKTIRYEVVAKAAGKLTNKAVVTADGGLKEEIDATVTVREARLLVSLSAPKKFSASKAVPFRITLSNAGNDAVNNVVVTNPIPQDALLVAATEGADIQPGRVRWTVARLAAGEKRIFEVQLKGKSPGELVNRVEAMADGNLQTTASARTDLIGQAALLFEVVDAPDPIGVGKDSTYEMVIRNQGTLPATNIRVKATIPAELGIVRIQGPVDHKRDGQGVAYEPLNLPAGSEAVLRITVRGLKAGNVRFLAELTCDQLPAGALRESESTTIFDDRTPD